MPLPDDVRPFHSIGEVLALLKEDNDDVTISKIRFLEAQGLIEPERTPSGYRRFYPRDLLRLRWVLRQQREHFLPLRVIKERLVTLSDDELERDLAAEPAPPRPVVLPEPSLFERTAAAAGDTPSPPKPRPRAKPKRKRSSPNVANVSIDVLAEAVGSSPAFINELVRYGLIAPRHLGSEQLFDGDAAHIAGLAAQFAEHGIDARHLRMYKMAVEREFGVFEQVLLPLLRDHDEAGRASALRKLNELLEMGDELRRALSEQSLRQLY